MYRDGREVQGNTQEKGGWLHEPSPESEGGFTG